MIELLRHTAHLIAYSWRSLGPATLLRQGLRWSRDADARRVDSGFDARFGTDTNAELTPHEAGIPALRRRAATMYLPTMDVDLDAMLDALPWSEPVARDTTFVDIGSGKARVVLLAAMRRFREVIGVELSPRLHEVAERNLEIVRATGQLVSPARLVLGDATELAVPDGPFIAYLYHPFREPVAELMMDRLLASLATSPRPAAVLYGHPTLQRPLDPTVFERARVFRPVAEGGRRTRRFRIGWTVWTNRAWLDERAPRAVSA